ncbi:hypothetical protein [Peribacillus tepidiphilus]|nr:hypothetical protein [Peribacillus tepidiphilus]
MSRTLMNESGSMQTLQRLAMMADILLLKAGILFLTTDILVLMTDISK